MNYFTIALRRVPLALFLAGTIQLHAGLLTVGTNINITQHTNNQTETTIAINPTDPQNLFAGASSLLKKSHGILNVMG